MKISYIRKLIGSFFSNYTIAVEFSATREIKIFQFTTLRDRCTHVEDCTLVRSMHALSDKYLKLLVTG